MEFTRPSSDAMSGTWLQGQIETTYDELTAVFGARETTYDGDGKVRAEWILQFADGTVARIYDWKSRTPLGQVTDWHVGGHSARAVELVKETLVQERRPRRSAPVTVTFTATQVRALSTFLAGQLNDPDTLDSSGLSAAEKRAVHGAAGRVHAAASKEG